MLFRSIGIMRGQTSRPEIVDALARHISESLDNISVPISEDTGTFDFAALAFTKLRRTKPNQILPGW